MGSDRKINVVILHNILSPYKTLLFNELYKMCNGLKVLYISKTEKNREWEINEQDLKFPFEIMFKGSLNKEGLFKSVIKTWKRLNFFLPDVVIISGYHYSACWAAFFWAKFNRKKIILWSSSNEDDHKRIFFKEILKVFLIKRYDASNVYGKRSRDYLIKLGIRKNKVFIMGNSTNNDFYYTETMKWKKKKELLYKHWGLPSNNFLYIGRFAREKNILSLLEAYKKLMAEKYNWGLILVGSGPQRKEINEYIKKHNLKNVFLPGFQQKEQIPKFLAVSNVFILPSISESWGLVVNEAMASGLPVLVSKKCGCYPDLIKKSVNGFSFDPFNREELYSFMKNVLEGKYDLEKMGLCSLEVIKYYSVERAAEVINRTIKFVLSNGEK